ncbi:MAG TPA: DotU family type VI secretion system protein [Burkholderiaceae bacterium]|nr:DotU family type VI secretion system protein [Burkholderiaceae bacterium]
MASNDPFDRADLERTIIVPMPGGRGRPPPPRLPEAALSGIDQGTAASDATSGLNPLVAAANPLLRLVPQLRATSSHADPAALRDQLVAALRNFEEQARAHGVESHKIRGATYALATLLDETIASTPWGSSGAWAQQTLLVLFHNESWGGEKFFQLLARLAENVPANRDLLELLYACLALGFEGRYRIIDNGRGQLEAVRQRLAELLRKDAGEYERALSPHWQGKLAKKKSDWAAAPLWIGVALVALLLLGGFLLARYQLSTTSDPVYAQITSIRVKGPPPPEPLPAPKPRLATFLEREIKEGLVGLREDNRSSVITIRGDGLFGSGSANVAEQYVPLLDRIARALAAVPGRVVVLGHTDNQPINRAGRFPSNWDLSRERAKAVVADLASTGLDTSRFSFEGRADSEPIATNSTAEGRARNRRVEIVLYAPVATPPK